MENSIYTDHFEDQGEEPWTGGARSVRLPRGNNLGASVYELQPNTTTGYYHFHHGAEEMLMLIKGRPIIRTPEGERQLIEGEVVYFPVGLEGAHQIINNTDEAVRLVMISTQISPEVVEYPDNGMVSIMAKTNSQLGEPLWDIRELSSEGNK